MAQSEEELQSTLQQKMEAADRHMAEFVGVVEAIVGTGLMGCQTSTFRLIISR